MKLSGLFYARVLLFFAIAIAIMMHVEYEYHRPLSQLFRVDVPSILFGMVVVLTVISIGRLIILMGRR